MALCYSSLHGPRHPLTTSPPLQLFWSPRRAQGSQCHTQGTSGREPYLYLKLKFPVLSLLQHTTCNSQIFFHSHYFFPKLSVLSCFHPVLEKELCDFLFRVATPQMPLSFPQTWTGFALSVISLFLNSCPLCWLLLWPKTHSLLHLGENKMKEIVSFSPPPCLSLVL